MKFKFNMVEIALAIVIIAIGLSSILVLFPIGINATRAAMDENGFPDAAEYISSYIRGQILTTWKNEFETKTAPGAPPIQSDATVFSTSFSGFSDTNYKTDPTDGQGFTWGNPIDKFPELTKASGSDGVYKFVRTDSTGTEVFSTIIKVWNSNIQNPPSGNPSSCPLYIPNTSSSFQPTLNITLPCGSLNEMIQSFMIEISWPVTAPEAERTKRVFRLDVNNPYYFPRS